MVVTDGGTINTWIWAWLHYRLHSMSLPRHWLDRRLLQLEGKWWLVIECMMQARPRSRKTKAKNAETIHIRTRLCEDLGELVDDRNLAFLRSECRI